jgi:hypothetical protein
VKYTLQYQHKGPLDLRPEDYAQQDDLTIEEGEPVLMPSVGDYVALKLTQANKLNAYKVVSRLFGYSGGWCHINIVVTDLEDGEYAGVLKE